MENLPGGSERAVRTRAFIASLMDSLFRPKVAGSRARACAWIVGLLGSALLARHGTVQEVLGSAVSISL